MSHIEFLTEKRFTLSFHLIQIATENNLSLIEFLLLMYFEDTEDKNFDVSKICTTLALKEQDVLEAFNNLLTSNLVKLESSKDKKNKHCESISLEPLYNLLVEKNAKKQAKEQKENIFDMFEQELGRALSPMEYEIVNAWLEKGFSEELVEGALKEAVYNGVSSLRYIDKILYEWQKKGYKKMVEVKEGLFNRKNEVESSLELFDYNWLEDEG